MGCNAFTRLPEIRAKIRGQCGSVTSDEKPTITRPSNPATLAKVKMFWISAPVFTPKMLITESAMTIMMAIRFWVLIPTSMLPTTIE